MGYAFLASADGHRLPPRCHRVISPRFHAGMGPCLRRVIACPRAFEGWERRFAEEVNHV